MEIICETCETVLYIPDETIPRNQQITIHCPKCKNKLTLDTLGLDRESPVPGIDQQTEQESPGADTVTDSEGANDNLKLYEEGVKLALVIKDDAQTTKKIKQAVDKLGYKFILVETPGEAIGKMRLYHFDLVILSDQPSVESEQSPILHYLNNLSMPVRRRMFLVLIETAFVTMDEMATFAMSANLIVNRKDLDELTRLLKYAISDNEKFYKVFMDTLAEIRK